MSRFVNSAMMSHAINRERSSTAGATRGTTGGWSSQGSNPILLAYQEGSTPASDISATPTNNDQQQQQPSRHQLTTGKLQALEWQTAPPSAPFAVSKTSVSPILTMTTGSRNQGAAAAAAATSGLRRRSLGTPSGGNSDTWSLVGGAGAGEEITPIAPSPTFGRVATPNSVDEDGQTLERMYALEAELDQERQSRLRLQDQIRRVSQELMRQTPTQKEGDTKTEIHLVKSSIPLSLPSNGKPPLSLLKKPLALPKDMENTYQREQQHHQFLKRQNHQQPHHHRNLHSAGSSRSSNCGSQYSERVRRRVFAERTNLLPSKQVEFRLPQTRVSSATSSRATSIEK